MDNNILSEIAEKMTELENVIFLSIVEVLQKEGIPPVMGRIIIGNVYRQFADNANYISSTRAVVLQNELRKQKEAEENKAKESKDEENKKDESVVKKMQKQNKTK